MKRIVHYSIFSLLLALLMGCTLSMDEWVETEEQKGYGNVEHVENDLFTLDYEYKSTTRSLTDEIQKYVAQVEADSIIYFLDNIPSDWLPQVGGQVVANCGEKFPRGLLGHVLSVDHQNGLFKVVTSEATLEDCYEDFNLEFASPLYTSNDEQETDTVSASRQVFTRAGAAGEPDEIVIRDWGMFNDMQRRKSSFTRASIEDIYKEDVDSTKTKTSDFLFIQVKPGDAIGAAIKNFTKGFINTINANIYYTTKTKLHKIVRLKEKYEYTYTDESGGIKFDILIGNNLASAKTKKANKELADNLFFALKNSQSKYAQNLSKNVHPGKPALTLEFPIFSLPVHLIIRVKPVVDVNLGLYGEAKFTVWLSRSVTTTIVRDGKKKKDESEKKTPSTFSPENFNIVGNLNVAGGLEVFLGAGKILLNGEALAVGVRGQMTLNFDLTVSPKTFGLFAAGTAEDNMKLSGKGEIGGAFLTGGWWGDIHFLTHKFTWWDGVTKTFNPKMKFDTSFPFTEKTDEAGVPYHEQTLTYTFTDLGIYTESSFWATENRPILVVYANEDDDLGKPLEVLYPTNSGNIKKNRAYKFVYKNYRNQAVYIVPGVGEKDGVSTIYPAYKQALQPILKPTIEYDVLYDEKTKGYEYIWQTGNKSYLTVQNGYPITYYTYKFALPFTLRNAHTIDDYWDDWGVMFKVRMQGQSPVEKYKSLKNAVQSSGKYAVEFRFNTSYNVLYDPMTVEAYVYYVPKGRSLRYMINSYNEKEYSYQIYKTNSKDKGDILLNMLNVEYNEDYEFNIPKDFKKFTLSN